MAQQARPNVMGQMEFLRAQLTALIERGEHDALGSGRGGVVDGVIVDAREQLGGAAGQGLFHASIFAWPAPSAPVESKFASHPMPSETFEQLLDRAASLYGIEPGYWDIWGRHHGPPPAAKQAILRAHGRRRRRCADELERSLAARTRARMGAAAAARRRGRRIRPRRSCR